MLKRNKRKCIISSVVILLPMLAGLLLWDRLPVNMVIHWGADGAADGTGNRWIGVFLTPSIFLAAHWLCLLITAHDPKNKGQNQKAVNLLFWIIPVCGLFINGFVYATALDFAFEPSSLVTVMMGLLFVLLGNYMPKVKQNSTFGIKVIWALQNEENWNKTHRFGGKLWFAGGLILLFSVFLPNEAMVWVIVVVLTVLAAAPITYSCWIYKKQKDSGTALRQAILPGKHTVIASRIFVAVILLLVAVMLFTGDVSVMFGEDALEIRASYHTDATVSYAKIDSVTYRTAYDPGTRTFGFGSPRLSLGTFENAEFGAYTRYTYTNCPAGVVIESEGKILILNGKTEADTQALYTQILEKYIARQTAKMIWEDVLTQS